MQPDQHGPALTWYRACAGYNLGHWEEARAHYRRNTEWAERAKTLRDHARNNAEQDINITLGEYMDEDIDQQEWDLKGLSKWAMSKFGLPRRKRQ